MSEMLAPLVVFVYNRPQHTAETIESLANNRLAKDTEVFIFSDGPKNQKSAKEIEKVREYIDSLSERKIFKSVNVRKAEKNKGLANSVISGVTEVVSKYGKVIVLEDDLVSSPDFLEYMNEALDFYRRDRQIWSISGYTFKIDIPYSYKSDVYLSYRGCSWGWATWSDRWNLVDWEVKDYIGFKSDRKLRNRFNRGGLDMADMLDAQMTGKIDSWAIRWCYAQFKANMLTVYPTKSRIRNIGLDGTGTHSGATSKYDVLLSDGTRKCIFNTPCLEPRIIKSFRDYFGTELYFLVAKIKCYVKKLFIK